MSEDTQEFKDDPLTEFLSITELVDYLTKKYGWNKMIKWFKERRYTVTVPHQLKDTNLQSKVIMIKYMEYNRLWKPNWARECRGVVIANINGKITCLKALLQRGAEVYTSLHKAKGIDETQDTSIGQTAHLDYSQQEVIKSLESKSKLNGIMSMKKDGSLLGISLYPRNTKNEKLMKKIITDNGSEFANLLMNETKNLPFLPVMSSQGTLLLGDTMESYTVTSIVCGIIGIDYTTLQNEIKQDNLSPSQVLYQYIPVLAAQLWRYWQQCSYNQKACTMCLCFETICANRIDAWGIKHTELAVSYPKASIDFLGCRFEVGPNVGYYRTHAQLQPHINTAKFTQPLYWNISTTKNVEDLMIGLHEVMTGKISVNEFLIFYRPENTLTNDVIYYLDYEGFVLFTPTLSTDVKSLMVNWNMNYSKIKTPEYYWSHKFKPQNVMKLLELSIKCSEIFPLLKAVRSFYVGLEGKLMSIFDQLDQRMTSILSTETKINFDEKKETKNVTLLLTIPDKPLKNLWNKPSKVKRNMIIATSSGWAQYVLEQFQIQFPQLQNDDQTIKLLRDMSMRIGVNNPERSSLLKTMVANTRDENKYRRMFMDLFSRLNV